MRGSKAEIFYHFVWAVKCREPRLTGDVLRSVLRCVEFEALQLGCRVMALNAMPDHVHLCVQSPTRLSPSEIAQRVKGVSSHFAHDNLADCESFRWQEGYGVFSLSRCHVPRVVEYIRSQQEHHASVSVWPDWEETGEEYAQPKPGEPSASGPSEGRLAEGP
jgi:putative transposase